MNSLWREGTGTAREVTSVLNELGREPLSSKTVLTCLTRLESKGLVAHSKEGRTFRFYPILSRRDVVARHIEREVNQLLEVFGELVVTVFVRCTGSSPEYGNTLRRLMEANDEGSDS
jgi:predicted transcriptional regulator